MKIIRFLLTILTILSLSISIAFAGIPGITEPFDPPNYYSPTSVSIPDSAVAFSVLRIGFSSAGSARSSSVKRKRGSLFKPITH